MLKQLGRLERTRNIVILGFAILMAVSLVFFYAPGRSAGSLDPTKNTEVIATVGSDSITVADLARVKANAMQRFGGRINIAQLGGSKLFLDGMIRKLIVNQEAERLGLGASDEELAKRLREQFTDATGNFIGLEKYKEAVVANYGDVEKFENDVRAEIAQEKLRAFVIASINVSDAELEEEYKRRNSTFDVSYVALAADITRICHLNAQLSFRPCLLSAFRVEIR